MNWWKIASDTVKVWLTGTLRRTREGFIYVDVPDSIIKPFLQMIPDKGVIHPSEASDKYAGAHISVMRSSEIEDQTVKEIGETIEYQLIGLESTAPEGWDGVKTVYFLTVYSPDLEELREKYELDRKYKGHDFHITVGLIKE
jgi:hypothetical protein